MDYRKKKTLFLDEKEWVIYPDPAIPAIVSEELWDKANAIYKKRSLRVKSYGVGYQSRYPYSGKIICGKHGTTFHRQSFKTEQGVTEYWKCKVSREKGKAGCDMPSIRTNELDAVMKDLFGKLVTAKNDIIKLVLNSLKDTDSGVDNTSQIERLETQIQQFEEKKDKLLELSMENAITMQEFMQRNNRFNEQVTELRRQILVLQKQEQSSKAANKDKKTLERALREEMDFKNGIQSEVVGSILDHVVVCEGSTDKKIMMEIHLRIGGEQFTEIKRNPFIFSISSSRNTTPNVRRPMI